MARMKKAAKAVKSASKGAATLDEGYNYAGPGFPGKMKTPASLKAAEKKHVKRKG